jgi:hypothetical protein
MMTIELRGALARFDDDVRALCGVTSDGYQHRRVTGALRRALETASGAPYDAAWGELIAEIAALLAAVREPLHARVRNAAARLDQFVEENADLLERRKTA